MYRKFLMNCQVEDNIFMSCCCTCLRWFDFENNKNTVNGFQVGVPAQICMYAIKEPKHMLPEAVIFFVLLRPTQTLVHLFTSTDESGNCSL